jgi:hypothetical protein
MYGIVIGKIGGVSIGFDPGTRKRLNHKLGACSDFHEL